MGRNKDKTPDIRIDPETGLPNVPLNYFWEIKQATGGYLIIKLMGRETKFRTVNRWLFFAEEKPYEDIYEVDNSWVCLTDLDTDLPLDERQIRDALKVKAVEMVEGMEREIATKDVIADIIGTYPPKKL